MTPERARQIWQHRGTQNQIPDGVMTPHEKAEVMLRWKQLPGHSCWMDAFFTFLHPNPYEVCHTDDQMRATIFNHYLQRTGGT